MAPRRAGSGALPNLIVIGAMKCGTTSLHYYLDQHPQIRMSRPKELQFFIEEQNWSRGLDWYRSHFDAQAPVRGESSPSYTAHPVLAGAAERIHATVPDARLIYLVRDPIERIVSHHVQATYHGRESRSIGEALRDFEDNPYVCRSRFAMQLERYLAYFPASRILVVDQDDLARRRHDTLRRVFRFLGVAEDVRSWKFALVLHRTTRKRPPNRVGALLARTGVMRLARRLPGPVRWLVTYPVSRPPVRPVLDDCLRAALVAHLKDDVARLRSLTGLSLSSWSV